jgi:hypothetical protein
MTNWGGLNDSIRIISSIRDNRDLNSFLLNDKGIVNGANPDNPGIGTNPNH